MEVYAVTPFISQPPPPAPFASLARPLPADAAIMVPWCSDFEDLLADESEAFVLKLLNDAGAEIQHYGFLSEKEARQFGARWNTETQISGAGGFMDWLISRTKFRQRDAPLFGKAAVVLRFEEIK